MCIYIYIHIYIYTSVYLYICISIFLYIYIYTAPSISLYIYIYRYTYIGMDSGLTFDGLLIVFPLAHATWKPSKTIVCIMNLHVFTNQKGMVFIMLIICFATCFGIDVWWLWASILVPFWNPSGVFFHAFTRSMFWWLLGMVSSRIL